MKVKVKGLVFAGAAAAILLSAGAANAAKTPRYPNTTEGNAAAAADAGVVTSKKFTETTYEYVADKVSEINSGNAADEDKYPSVKATTDYTQPKFGGSGITTAGNQNAGAGNRLVTATTTAGEIKYTDIVEASTATATTDGWADSSYTFSDYKVPSEAAVKAGLDALEQALGGASTKKQQQSNSSEGTYKVGHTGDTWATLGTNGYVEIDTTNSAAPKIQLVSSKIESTAANVNATADGAGAKLVTASAVQGKQTTANTYQVSKDAAWENVSSAVGVVANGYLTTDSTRADGGVNVNLDETKVAASSTTAANFANADNASKLSTVGAAKTYADSKVTQNITNGTTATAPSEDAVYDALALKQNKQIGLQGVDNEDSVDFEKVLTVNEDGAITITDYKVDHAIVGDDTKIPTDLAVKTYVDAGLGGITLPAMNKDCSKAGSHCSLVTSWDASSSKIKAEWVVMAGAEGTGSNNIQ